ncbi:uncharacterized protein BKA55DRAFT_536648 [Fusarium redolens]|uniref:DUF7735 domain-containing protein n=1 Tax=Fusarium redolens TaxID=48865 RepID=A0A9P9HL24_FUSRE|nr:uncharacterized protein BKA55DRAFT_536648 [Fusarium redolens]KAH7258938.1 hypothetical protein BKA55DRAFT_536648 [Fusarium redolens]
MPEDKTGFGDPQQAGAYATYIYHARESQVLLTDPNSELRRLWVKTLELFGGSLREICLFSPRDDDDRLCHIGGLDYLCKVYQGIPYHLGPHRHLDHDVAYGCRYPAAIAGDALFSTVISCLAASGVAITQITVRSIITGTFDCTKLPGRDLLDFSALEKIEFSPEIPDGEHHSGYEDLPCLRREEIEKRTAKILNAMAHKYLAILKSLILNGRGIMDWPIEPPTLEFPVLGQFIHAFGWVNPIMSTWLRNMPKLRYLKLDGLDRSLGTPYIEWRHLFNAIRDHPSVTRQSTTGLEVESRYIHTSQWYCLEKYFYNELPFKRNYGLRFMLAKREVTSSNQHDNQQTWSVRSKLVCNAKANKLINAQNSNRFVCSTAAAETDKNDNSPSQTASSWWAEDQDDITSGAHECPKRWFNQMVGIPYAQVRLNNTITFGACYDLAKRHVKANSTEALETPETPVSTTNSGQEATKRYSHPTSTETSISSNTENTSRVLRVESWTLIVAMLVAICL